MIGRSVVGSLCLLALVVFPAAADPPPAAAYGRLPAVSDAAISPDGTKIALAQNNGDTGLVRVLSLSGADIAGIRTAPGQRLRSVSFADDDTVIGIVSQTFKKTDVTPAGVRFLGPAKLVTYNRAIAFSLTAQQPHILLSDTGSGFLDADASAVFAPIEGDPGFARMVGYFNPEFEENTNGLAITSADDEQEGVRLYRVDLATGRSRPVESFKGAGVQVILDERGRVVAHTEANRVSNRWRLFSHSGRTPRVVAEDRDRIGVAPTLTLMPDGRLGFIETPAGADKSVLRAIDLASGEVSELFNGGARDVSWAIVDPWTHRLVGAGWVDDFPRQKFFDPALDAALATLQQRLPNSMAVLASWSRDRSRMLAHIERPGDGGGWYLVEPATGGLKRLALDYPEIEGSSIGDVLAITYKARDDTPIPAVLTLPRGAEPRNLPLVLLVHGGPASRDSVAFDWWAQFLASRGYAVLQPNFRGSSGFGDAWENAGLKQWGRLMQTDVEDGAAALARSGRVDPARICIVGASYGGYAALAGATLTPSRYACAISVNGVADPESFLDARIREYGSNSSVADYWRLSIGDPGDDRSAIRAISPFRSAAAATAPILLIHRQEDSTVPIDQSRRMKEALERAGKSVRYVELAGDDHYLSAPSTRTRMLEEVDAFLRQHLVARAP